MELSIARSRCGVALRTFVAWLLFFVVAMSNCQEAMADPGVPYEPRSDRDVLLELAPRSDPESAKLKKLREQQQSQPRNLESAEQLARAYIDFGRQRGDARYLGRALAVIEPWLTQELPPIDALLIKATVLQARHQFEQSKQVLLGLLQRDSENSQAWLTLASIYQVLGDLEQARHACARLMGGMDALVAATCISGLNAVTGRARNAYETLDLMLARTAGEPPEIQAWVHGVMADAARYLGDTARSEQHFKAGLALVPRDNFLLAGYSDLLLDLDRPAEVLVLLRREITSDPLFLRYVLAEARLGVPDLQNDISDLKQRFRDLALRGDQSLYAREEARFQLWLQHDARRALTIALEDWALQRAPDDARIVLEASIAANDPLAAGPVVDFVRQTRLEDPSILKLADRIAAPAVPALPLGHL